MFSEIVHVLFSVYFTFSFFFSKKHNGNSRDVTLPHILH